MTQDENVIWTFSFWPALKITELGVRTAVMMVAGGLLLAAYIFIKKQKAKALQAEETTIEETQA